MLRLRKLAFLLGFLLPTMSHAWSYKEHTQITRLAVMRLLGNPQTPDAMKVWLRDSVAGLRGMDEEREFLLHARVGDKPQGFIKLEWWVCVPDILATSAPRTHTVEPFGAHERLLHYLDLELLQAEEKQRGYRHDLSGMPAFEDIPRTPHDPQLMQAGFLPYRIEQVYGELVKALRDGRLEANDETPQPREADHAVKWAGYLCHYVQDNTQPHHATVDYRSASYFAAKRAPNVHAEMEWRMLDDEKEDFMDLREEYWPMLQKELETAKLPKLGEGIWEQSVRMSLASYDALPLIGLAAMTAAGQGGTPDAPEGPHGDFDTRAFFRYEGAVNGESMTVMRMKARQVAWAVLFTEKVLLQAWLEAH
jgi:hypothetical protein